MIENCKFPRCQKKTSVGKTANMWVFGQKNVIFSNSSFNSSDMPQTLSTAVTRHQRPWATWDDQWRSGEKLRKIQEFQGYQPTVTILKARILHKLGGITYLALLGQFPYIYLYYICKTTQRPLTQGVTSHHLPPLNAKQKVLRPQAWHFAWQRHNQWLWSFPLPWVERSIFLVLSGDRKNVMDLERQTNVTKSSKSVLSN